MEENYLLALLISFLFGFVLFKKDKKTPDETQKMEFNLSTKDTNVSGVEKYLKNQQAITDLNIKLSGVSQYIQEKESLIVEKEERIAISSVAKYLATKEKESPVSSVSKYMAKKTIHAKKLAKENMSGVEKYLNDRN